MRYHVKRNVYNMKIVWFKGFYWMIYQTLEDAPIKDTCIVTDVNMHE